MEELKSSDIIRYDNNIKKYIIKVVPVFLAISFLILGGYGLLMSQSNSLLNTFYPSAVEVSTDINTGPCVYTTGSFEGRKTPAHSNVIELVKCNHNVFYGAGKNATRDKLSGILIKNETVLSLIQLCNSTNASACGSPIAGGTEPFGLYAGCGFQPTNGTFKNFNIEGNWTISNTFTYTCSATGKTNVSRLSMTDNTTFAGATFTEVSSENNDQLILNWSLGAS